MDVTQKTYGSIRYDSDKDKIVIDRADPHVRIWLKKIFMKIPVTKAPPYDFPNRPDECRNLEWFMMRYPLDISQETLEVIQGGSKKHKRNLNELEAIHAPDYVFHEVKLNNQFQARHYQLEFKEVHAKVKRMLLGDDLGLGKSLSAALTLYNPGTLPAVIVVQTHMVEQWDREVIKKFTNLKVHKIKGTKIYDLPPADVYIMKYSCIAGWSDFYDTGYFKAAIFDECQEFRRPKSAKYEGGMRLSENVEFTLGLSATPIYNYGDEIFSVVNLLAPDSLGTSDEFIREWCIGYGSHYKVEDTQGLGSYLRERNLMMRRTRAEVGRELPPINKIIHTVDYDSEEVKKHEGMALELALKTTTGSFTERGQASRELDILARKVTGVSKARYVAQYVRIMIETGNPVLLAGWHRDVYTIWMDELKEFNPVMYTGSESEKQKENAKQEFVSGRSQVMIISLRSGAGLDGLQHICDTVVFGELDWSPKVHDQLTGRIDRDGRQETRPQQVNVYYLISEYGSDPVVIEVLGVKSMQSAGIVDPLVTPAAQHSDDSNFKQLAQQYLQLKK